VLGFLGVLGGLYLATGYDGDVGGGFAAADFEVVVEEGC